MSPNWIGPAVLCIVFSGAVLGMLVGRHLPAGHVTNETKTTISVSMAVVGTMSALLLGLLISSASSTFSTRNAEVARMSADIIWVNRLLRRYGPEADLARDTLRRYTAMRFADLFSAKSGKRPKLYDPATAKMLEHLQDMILSLKPGDGRQRWLVTQALQVAADLTEARWLLVQQDRTAIPVPALILIVFWLALLFASFGLFAPRNLTAAGALFLCCLAVSSAIAMIADLYTPFEGPVRLSDAPMRYAAEVISH